MMNDHFQKLALLAVVIVGVVFSHSLGSRIFALAGFTPKSMPVNTSTPRHDPPLIVLPSLSANIHAQEVITPSPTSAPAHPTNAPAIGATIALVADLKTGRAFMDVSAARRWPMASVSKLMTAVVATDLLAPDQKITITPQMVGADPTQQIFHAGASYTVSDLLRGMLLPSNNVAAEALASSYGRASFLAAMNAKAVSFGMTNTHYDDPSGLSAGNESTANDLLKLGQHIYADYAKIFAITRQTQATITDVANGGTQTVKNINNFSGQADFVGGKTGYTDQADGNLLSVFSYRGSVVFIVVMGTNAGDRFSDTQALYNWFKATSL